MALAPGGRPQQGKHPHVILDTRKASLPRAVKGTIVYDLVRISWGNGMGRAKGYHAGSAYETCTGTGSIYTGAAGRPLVP